MLKKEGTRMVQGYPDVTIASTAASGAEKNFKEIFEHANRSRKYVCPVRDIIERVSDKWSILVIYALGGYGVLRFNELKNKIGDISQRMLTVTLKNLETDGFINRKMYAEIPPRVEYTLTPLGYSLMQQFVGFAQWANENSADIMRSREKKK